MFIIEVHADTAREAGEVAALAAEAYGRTARIYEMDGSPKLCSKFPKLESGSFVTAVRHDKESKVTHKAVELDNGEFLR